MREIGYSLLIVSSDLGASLVAILFIGTAMSWGAALLPRFMDTLAATERGTGFGLVRTIYMIISATGSAVVGVVAGLASWNIAFGIFVIFLLFVCLALVTNRMLGLGL